MQGDAPLRHRCADISESLSSSPVPHSAPAQARTTRLGRALGCFPSPLSLSHLLPGDVICLEGRPGCFIFFLRSFPTPPLPSSPSRSAAHPPQSLCHRCLPSLKSHRSPAALQGALRCSSVTFPFLTSEHPQASRASTGALPTPGLISPRPERN